ncbi:hypothetical protein AJ87_35830 [Rhizobium yanglingense]|nr:hypothetical protein AJ87_35830 [Rhizobium yanglingense]
MKASRSILRGWLGDTRRDICVYDFIGIVSRDFIGIVSRAPKSVLRTFKAKKFAVKYDCSLHDHRRSLARPSVAGIYVTVKPTTILRRLTSAP